MGGAINSLRTAKKGVNAGPTLVATRRTLEKLGIKVDDVSSAVSKVENIVSKPGEPNDYKFQSGDVLKTLQELLKTFKENLAEREATEADEKHSHDMTEGARSNKI